MTEATVTLTEKSSMKSIIQRAKELDITEFIHDGVTTTVKTRLTKEYKQSLLDAIEKATAPIEQNIQTVEEELPEYAESADSVVEETKSFIRDAIREICFAEKASDFDKLYNLLGSTPANIISRILEIGTTPNTATKYRSKIFADLDREYNDLKESEFKKRFQYFLKNLRDSVYRSEALQQVVQEKREYGGKRLKERKDNKTAINPSNLIIWAVDILNNLDNKNSTHWKPVTQALKVLTGRRTSEILSSGRFIPSQIKGCLLFKGQNKKHSEETFKNETPIIIPVIGGHTEFVLHGMQWLNASGKRILAENDTWSAQMAANVRVNKNLGKYLSDFCRGVDGFHLDWYGLVETDEDWNTKKKPDVTRDIYTQVIGMAYYEKVKQELSATLDFLGQCLGHNDRGKTIIKYDVDFKVNFDDIKPYVQDIDLQSIPVE